MVKPSIVPPMIPRTADHPRSRRPRPAPPEEDQMTQTSPAPATRRGARALEGRRRGARSQGGARRAALVYQASNAAFTASTSTGSNAWNAGNVFVANDSSGAALFNVSAMKPGTAGTAATKCVVVSYTGSLAANLRLYLTGYSSTPRPAGPPGPLTAGSYDL